MESSWFDAIKANNIDVVKSLLDTIDINHTDDDGDTALIKAAMWGYTGIVSELCERDDIKLNQGDEDDRTPLYCAAQNGHLAVVTVLCNIASIAVNQGNKNGATPLYIAAQQGHLAVVTVLCNSESINVNQGDKNGHTPLYTAAQKGHLDVVTVLCNTQGIAVNQGTKNGCTPLHVAARQGHVEVLKELCGSEGIAVNQGDNHGDTPLYVAVLNRQQGALEYLSTVPGVLNIENNAGDNAFTLVIKSEEHPLSYLLYLYKLLDNDTIDVNKQYRGRKTLLHIAVEDNSDREVEHLLTQYPDLDVNVTDDQGNTPLHCAVLKEREFAVKILCKQKLIDISIKNLEGQSPLDIGVSTKYYPIIWALYKFVDVDIINTKYNENGETLLHHAVREKNKEALEYFCKVPGVRNIENNAGYTPFRLVTKSEEMPLSFLLYLYKLPGADANNVNHQYRGGKTLLHIAVEDDNSEEIEQLISKYTDLEVNAKDDQDYTPLHYAVLHNQINTVKLLCSKNTIDINGGFTGVGSDYKTPLLIRAIENDFTEIAVLLLTQSTIDVDVKDGNGNVFAILYHLVTAREPAADTDRDVISSLTSDYLTKNIVLSYDVPETLRELLQHEKRSVLEFLREKCNDSNISERLKQILSAILNVIVIGLQKYANHESLRYSFFKGSLYKTLIEIFLDKPETSDDDMKYTIQILKLIYMSLQARNPCDVTEKEFIRQSLIEEEFVEKSFDDDLFKNFEGKIFKLAWTDMTAECSEIQLLARNIYNAYIKEETGCLSDIKKYLEKIDKWVFKLKCSRRYCHYCIERGCLALLTCSVGIYVHASDIIYDAIVAADTLHGFSERLGIFMIVLVGISLFHENIRSSFELYATEEELLRVKLARFKLKKSDWDNNSDLNYSKLWHKMLFFRLVCPFKVQKAETSLLKVKAVTFNLLSIVQLRPIVDRLIVLVHSPSNIRTVYRQKSKQMSLNQYFMILEQMPELLVKFYLFQIFFNNIEGPSDQPKCLEGNVQSFSYDPVHFQCSPNFLNINMCVPGMLIYSMAIPFFKIPKSMLSLEDMFRKLDPMTPKMSSAATYLLYLAYIMLIPSRLFLFAGLMHASSNHFIVIGYIIVTSFMWMMANMIKLKEGKSRDEKFKEGKLKEDMIDNFNRVEIIYKKGSDLLLLYLFSCRDVLVISLRDPIAYMSKPSEVTYRSLRGWKKLMLISILYFTESLVGAVYIEHYYPCGMNTEIFKYQGWVWLVLQIFSATLLILLSYVLQPRLMNIIPMKIKSKSVHILTFGFVLCFFATITFFRCKPRDMLAERNAPIVVLAVFILLFAVAVLCLIKFGEAKKKTFELVKEKGEKNTQNESQSTHSCCSRLCFCCPCTQITRYEVEQVQEQPGSTEMIELSSKHEEEEDRAKVTSPLIARRSNVDIV